MNHVKGAVGGKGEPPQTPPPSVTRNTGGLCQGPHLPADIQPETRALANGRLLYLAKDPHRCKPPHGRDLGDGYGENCLLPAGPPGSVWRCDCGRLWQAGACSWLEAGWRTRWRYRKTAKA